MKFQDGDLVLCYYGQLLYKAKILECNLNNKDFRYRIHYIGWNSKKWDEWVDEEKVLEINKENLLKVKELAFKSSQNKPKKIAAKNLKIGFKKSQSKSKVLKERKLKPQLCVSTKHMHEAAAASCVSKSKESDIQLAGNILEAPSTSKNDLNNLETQEIIESLVEPDDKALGSSELLPRTKECYVLLENILEQNNNSIVDSMFPRVRKKLTARMSTGGRSMLNKRFTAKLSTRGKAHNSRMIQPNISRTIPVKSIKEELKKSFDVILPITLELQTWLEGDYQLIHVQKKRMDLPARITIDTILEHYMKEKKKCKSLSQSNKTNMVKFVSGVKTYFDEVFRHQLLYDAETEYCDKILSTNSGKLPVQLFGGIHLIRLLAKLDKIIQFRPYDELTATVLSDHFRSLVGYLSNCPLNIFADDDYNYF